MILLSQVGDVFPATLRSKADELDDGGTRFLASCLREKLRRGWLLVSGYKIHGSESLGDLVQAAHEGLACVSLFGDGEQQVTISLGRD